MKKHSQIAINLVLVATLFAACCLANAAEAVKLIAHRGGVVDETRIENNLWAIQEAILQGYWMLEVDIRETKDGQLIVHHDDNFTRYYGDPRRVQDMTLVQIRELRSNPGNLRPLTFAEYAAACRGKIRLMLDVKGDHEDEFYVSLRKTLNDHELLDSCFVLGPDQAKRQLQGDAKVSINGPDLRAAIAVGDDVAKNYFVFGIAAKIDKSLIQLANEHQVTVVPAINTFRYDAQRHQEQARQDIRRLRAWGISHYQIDSIYRDAFNTE